MVTGFGAIRDAQGASLWLTPPVLPSSPVPFSPAVPPSVRARQSTMNATANLSQSVTLACDADGFPEPTVTWTK